MFGQQGSKVQRELEQAVKMLKSLEPFWEEALSGNMNPHKIAAARTAVQMTVDHLEALVELSRKLHGLIEKSERIQAVIDQNL